jgi:hypothetical protein
MQARFDSFRLSRTDLRQQLQPAVGQLTAQAVEALLGELSKRLSTQVVELSGSQSQLTPLPLKLSGLSSMSSQLMVSISTAIRVMSPTLAMLGSDTVVLVAPRLSNFMPSRSEPRTVDHPKQLLLLTDAQVQDLTTLSATPFALGLENAQRNASTPKVEAEPEVTEEVAEEVEIETHSFDEEEMLDI